MNDRVSTCCHAPLWWDHCGECGVEYPDTVRLDYDELAKPDRSDYRRMIFGAEKDDITDRIKHRMIVESRLANSLDDTDVPEVGPFESVGRIIGATAGRYADAAVRLAREWQSLASEFLDGVRLR